MSDAEKSWGASPEEWAHFDLVLGLTEDLLPVVSNPQAVISPLSKMKGLGKTPSIYNPSRKVAGIPEWTTKRASGAEVDRWAKEGDYGLCLQTRGVRALDIDIDDAALAARVAERFAALVGAELPTRSRQNSGKRLLAFHVRSASGGSGEDASADAGMGKRSFRLDGGLVEFLADGQQFVALGTHPSGSRYAWAGGLPDEFPSIGAPAFEAAWQMLVDEFATAPATAGVLRKKGETVEGVDDAVADWLLDQGLVLGEGRDGALYVDCPWKGEHSNDSGITEAAWFPAGTNGYERGNFRCLHAHCDGRGAGEFEQAVGYTTDLFEALPPAGAGDGPPDESASRPGAQVFDRGDLTLIAQASLRKRWRVGEHATLLRACGGWYEWGGKCYDEVGDEEVRSDLWRYLAGVSTRDKKGNIVPLHPTRDYIGNVADALKAVAEQRGACAPCWLPGGAGPDPAELVSLADGVLYVPERKLLPHSPKLFTLNSLPYAWGDSRKAPGGWLDFLEAVWPGDSEAQETLQEMFGYLLTADTSQQKMFMVIGPRRSGKGTIGRVLSALIGQHNTCGPTMQQLTGEFGLETLIGKLVALIPDARVGGGTNVQAIVEKMLMLSGEDSMTINRKNKSFWTGRPTARIVILSNEAPKLGDASGALPGRFIVLSLRQSFYGREDRGLTGRLLAELPAIFRWALDGRDRLAARGYFRQPDSGLDDADELGELGNPMASFVEDCCVLDPEASEATDHLYEAWRDWCGRSGHMAGARETFGRSLRVAFPQIQRVRKRADERRYSYAGLRLSDEARKILLIGGGL